MRRPAAFVLATATIALGAAAAEVFAAPPRSNEARARPAWSSLPVGEIPKPPQHEAAPARLAEGDRAVGLRIVREPGHPAHRVRARVEPESPALCMAPDVDLQPHRDPGARSASAGVELRLGTVTAVRIERVDIAADGGAALHTTDVWVDPRTLGAKLASESRIPLATLARGPAGAVVYGYRTEAGELWAVVPTPNRVMPPASSLSGRDHGGEMVVANCGHIRVAVGGADGGSGAVVVPMELSAEDASPGSRTRPGQLAVRASVAKLSRDPAPQISVLLSWTESPPPRPLMMR